MALDPATVIVLDRDGVINEDSPDYIKSVAEWHAIPGSLEAIAKLKAAGHRVCIATNQSGVARGLFTLETLADIHNHMLTQVTDAGGDIQQIFFCPDGPDDNSDCRKPKPGMLLQAAEHFASGFDRMIMIGDSERDLQAADAVGMRRLLVRTGKGTSTEQAIAGDSKYAGLEVHDDLSAAVDALLSE